MKILYTALIALTLAISTLAGEVKPVWLTRYVSVVTEDGIKGYAAGTMLVREGDKFRAGQDVISVPETAITDNLDLAGAIAKGDQVQQAIIKKQIADDAKVVEAVKPKVVDKGPKVVYSTPQMSRLGTSSLQMSKGLGASGPTVTTSGAHSQTSRGFYVNPDGSLGKRVGEK